jgi:CHASE2 domain-containing sensor protein
LKRQLEATATAKEYPMNLRLQVVPRPLSRLGRRFWVPFLLACAIVWLSELGVDYLVENEDFPGITQTVFNLGGLYQRIVTAPRNPVPRYTVIVEVDPNKDRTLPGLTDICDQRAMIKGLLYGIAKALPSVIVLDKYYLPHRPQPCPADPELLSAVQNVRRSNIPVIVGRRVSDESIGTGSAARYYLMSSIVPDDSNPCEAGVVNMDIGAQKQPCQEGVVNIDLDTRKLPLEWALFAGEEQAKKGQDREWYDTLALRAARAYDDKLMDHHKRLAPFIKRREHPYISFLNMGDFEPVPAGQILRGESTGGASDGSLPDPKLSGQLRRMRGKIVVVGEINWDLDAHRTVVGKMPGVYAQANYIEALLDDRYFRPIPFLDYVSGFVILAALELILIVYRGRWWTMALLIGALFVLALALLYMTIMHLGWYVNPAALGVIAVTIKLVHALFGRAEQAVERQQVTGNENVANPTEPR